MNSVFAVLGFFRIVDENGVLSLTNIAVMASLYVLLHSQASSIADLAPFLAAITSYQAKRWMAPDTTSADATAELKAAIESLQTKVTAIQLSQGGRTR